MTKKSLGRMARDAEKARNEANEKKMKNAQALLEGNTCYDELNDIRDSCKQLLMAHANMGVYLNNKELIAEVEDKGQLVTLIKSLASDLKTLTGELGEISKQHEGKTGGTDDPNTIVDTIRIHEQYHLFMERHQAVVMPTVNHILEHIDAAATRLAKKQQAEKAAADATNPNVTTDVEFKEVGDAAATNEG